MQFSKLILVSVLVHLGNIFFFKKIKISLFFFSKYFKNYSDSVYLTSGDENGPTGYSHGFSFDAAEYGQPFGLVLNGVLEVFFFFLFFLNLYF